MAEDLSIRLCRTFELSQALVTLCKKLSGPAAADWGIIGLAETIKDMLLECGEQAEKLESRMNAKSSQWKEIETQWDYVPEWRSIEWYKLQWILPVEHIDKGHSFVIISAKFEAFALPDHHKKTGFYSVKDAIAAGKAEIDEWEEQLQRDQSAAA